MARNWLSLSLGLKCGIIFIFKIYPCVIHSAFWLLNLCGRGLAMTKEFSERQTTGSLPVICWLPATVVERSTNPAHYTITVVHGCLILLPQTAGHSTIDKHPSISTSCATHRDPRSSYELPRDMFMVRCAACSRIE
jgi:hypothetical protein